MLVLTVKDGESIVIGRGDDEARVTLIKTERGRIRLGVACGRHIEVDRESVRQVKDAELGGEG